MNTNNIRPDFEIENYFSKIRASFAKKFIVTTMDLFYIMVFNLPIFIIIMYWTPGQGMVETFHKLVEKNQSNQSNQISAERGLIFSVWTLFMFYIYFVLIPSKTKYQTLFSVNFGMRAVTIHDNLNYTGKITQKQMFRANFVPVFSFPLINLLFFSIASITNRNDWHEKILKSGETEGEVIRTIFKSLMIVAAFLQFHHVFTVAASKKVLNWFVKSNGIIYVDEEKADLFMRNKDKPMPVEQEQFLLKINMPGIPEENIEEESNEGPDFSEKIVTDPVK